MEKIITEVYKVGDKVFSDVEEAMQYEFKLHNERCSELELHDEWERIRDEIDEHLDEYLSLFKSISSYKLGWDYCFGWYDKAMHYAEVTEDNIDAINRIIKAFIEDTSVSVGQRIVLVSDGENPKLEHAYDFVSMFDLDEEISFLRSVWEDFIRG